MEQNTLFINACPRPGSRTLRLARHVLGHIGGKIQEINLAKHPVPPLDGTTLQQRDGLLASGNLQHPLFRLAHQFAAADVILVAAPLWDLAFPALLKAYLEAITVRGITFRYTPEGQPDGLCRAHALYYVTTSGGPSAHLDLGRDYLHALGTQLLCIPHFHDFRAENLDIQGNDPEAILADALAHVDCYFQH